MTDLNWCTSCDNAVSPFSESLYCSEQCLREDALRNHPLLGYTYPEFIDFPRPNIQKNHTMKSTSPKLSYSSNSSSRSSISSVSTSPALTATSSNCDSVHQLSPPKFDLLSSTTLPPVITTATAKPTHFNYFSVFDHQHRVTGNLQ